MGVCLFDRSLPAAVTLDDGSFKGNPFEFAVHLKFLLQNFLQDLLFRPLWQLHSGV